MTSARTATGRFATAFIASLALLVLAPVAGAATASGSVGFGVAPLKFDINVTPGQASTYQIIVTNTDDTATKFTFSKEDYEGDKEDPAATPVLLGGKFDSAISGYDWIVVPDPITIPAGQSRTIPVRVVAPAGSTGGHYAALIVEGTTSSAGQIVTQSRLGVLFLMNAGGTPPPDIKITEIKEVGPNKTVTRIRYTNEGTTHTKPKPQVTVIDPVTGKRIRRNVGTCSTALPGGSGVCHVDDEDTDNGGGTLVGNGNGNGNGGVGSGSGDTNGDGFISGAEQKQVDLFGEDEGTSAKGELPTEWAGAWTSMLLPLVGVALFVLYFLFLRRRRKDGEGDDVPGIDAAFS